MRHLALLLALAPAVASAAVVDRLVAVVGDEPIALSEVYELGASYIEERCGRVAPTSCRRAAELEILDSLILRELLRQELVRLGLDVTPSDVERAIAQIAQDNAITTEQLRAEVEGSGLPWETYRDQLSEQLRQVKFTEAVLRARIDVSEDEMLDLYQRTVRDFSGPPTVDLEAFALAVPPGAGQDALVETVGRARAAVEALRAGTREWKATVAELDSGVYAPREGRMGSFKKGGMLPAVEEAVFATPTGGYTDPVLVGEAVYVIKVVDRRDSDALPYEQVKERLRERIVQEKADEELEKWYQQARRKSAVRVLLE